MNIQSFSDASELDEFDVQMGAPCPWGDLGWIEVSTALPNRRRLGFSEVKYRCKRCTFTLTADRDDRYI
jgi:hypothetical protein